MVQMNLLTKQKETHRLGEQIYGWWGRGGIPQGIVGEFWDGHVHTAMFKIDRPRTFIEYMKLCSMMCGSLDGRGVHGRMDSFVCVLSPFTIHLKLSQHC